MMSNWESIIKKIEKKDVILPLLTEAIDGEIMDAAPKLKIISNYAVGFNNVDLAAATERGILVTNTPGVLTDTTADCAFAMMMASARRIPSSERYARAGKFKGWEPLGFLGQDIYEKTLGIVGFGRIGMAMAKRASGFDMKILYYDEFRASEKNEKKYNTTFVSLEELLQQSDFVSLHPPLTPTTHHLIGQKEFSLMKKTACIVNTARGPVIEEKALVKAMENETIFGAALDVFEFEPAIPEALKKLENVIIIPHIASATFYTRTRMSEIAAQNIINVFEGKMPVSLVNKEVLGKNNIRLEIKS
jgi:glyoxylate reductase